MGTPYSLAYTTVVAGGRIVEGFGEGDVIEISRESNEWEHVKNADGSIINCANLDRSAMVTLRLRYNSPLNSHLSNLADARAYFEFSTEWPNGDLVQGGETLVHKRPDIRDGQKTGNREWQLFINRCVQTWGPGGG